MIPENLPSKLDQMNPRSVADFVTAVCILRELQTRYKQLLCEGKTRSEEYRRASQYGKLYCAWVDKSLSSFFEEYCKVVGTLIEHVASERFPKLYKNEPAEST